tara:strand:- start:4415 stop:5992 length:1578 start_codon:yes stop_codon:yes gene_type:complete
MPCFDKSPFLTNTNKKKFMNLSLFTNLINKVENSSANSSKESLSWFAIIAIAIFYLLTLRTGHYWGGDFSQYIHHAKNLIEGKPYNDILYVVNGYAYVSPPTYPPIFPILLVPIISVFGDSLLAMKILVISFFILSLAVIIKLYQHRLNKYSLLLLVLIIGFNPLIWSYKDKILSDFPYIFFSLVSLYLMQNNFLKASWKKSFLLGFFMYLAYGTREIGLILPLTLLSYDIWHYRKPTFNTLLSCSLFTIFAMFQWKLMQFEPLYPEIIAQLSLLGEKESLVPSPLSFVNFDIENIIRQLRVYYHAFFTFWQIKDYALDSYFYFFINIFTIIGFITTIKNKINIVEIYFVGYLFVLILFGGVAVRYIFPIIPFYVFYVLFGIFQLNYFNKKLSTINHLLLVLLLTFLYAFKFSYTQYGAIEPGIEDEQAKALFSFVKKNTDDSDILIFPKPRVLSLYTNRKASPYPYTGVNNPISFMNYIKAIDSQYLITFPKNQEPILLLLKRYPNNFRLIYNNPPYDVYKYIP